MTDFFSGLSLSDVILAKEYSDILRGLNLELARRNYGSISQTVEQNRIASLALFQEMVSGLTKMSSAIGNVSSNTAMKQNMLDMIEQIQTLSGKLVNTTTGN